MNESKNLMSHVHGVIITQFVKFQFLQDISPPVWHSLLQHNIRWWSHKRAADNQLR